MAKNKNPAQQQEEQKLEPASIMPAEDPGKNALDNIKLNFGEVLLVSLDENGNEGIPFKVNTGTYQRYYQDETKFRIKKTFQP